MTPRIFEEIAALYSNDMVDVFSGGLVYEYSQEPNRYGLVEIQQNGNIKLLPDFLALKDQYEGLADIDQDYVVQSLKKNAREMQMSMKSKYHGLKECETTYDNLDVSKGLPKIIANHLIEDGVAVTRGKYVPITDEDLSVGYGIFLPSGQQYPISPRIERVVDLTSGRELQRKNHLKGYHNCTYNDLEDEASDSTYDFTDEDEKMMFSNSISLFFQNVSKFFALLIRSLSELD